MLQLLAFFEAEADHDARHSMRRVEVAHQIIFEADVKSRSARVALSRTTPAQLSIDPARFVALRADNEEPALVGHTGTEFNIGPAAGHVGRNRDCSRLSGALNDLRLLHVQIHG